MNVYYFLNGWGKDTFALYFFENYKTQILCLKFKKHY